jgi:hypothetical protein
MFTKQLQGAYWNPDKGYKIRKQETFHVEALLIVEEEFIFCLSLPEVCNISF